MMRGRTLVVLALLVCSAAPSAFAAATPSDVVTIGTAVRTGLLTFDVPVYIRDVASTPLGIDQPAGSRIQSYSLKVDYAPSASIQSITFTRAGITTSLTPTLESSPSSPGSKSLLDTFHEATNLIPFTSNKAAPGDLVAHLTVTFAGSAPLGSTVTLTLDPTLTQLTDEGGDAATKETVAAGNLTLVNGSVTAPAVIPLLDRAALALLAAALIAVAFFVRRL
jgi:hypothetical protein